MGEYGSTVARTEYVPERNQEQDPEDKNQVEHQRDNDTPVSMFGVHFQASLETFGLAFFGEKNDW